MVWGFDWVYLMFDLGMGQEIQVVLLDRVMLKWCWALVYIGLDLVLVYQLQDSDRLV